MRSRILQISFVALFVFGFNANVFSDPVKGTQDNPYSVAEILAMTPETYPVGEYWVKGYCVGAMDNQGANGQIQLDQWLTPNRSVVPIRTNIVIADAPLGDGDYVAEPTEDDVLNVIAVELPTGSIRTALNVIDHPEIYQRQVTVYGEIQTYFVRAGIKNTSDYVAQLPVGVNDGKDEKFLNVYVSGLAIVVESDFDSAVEVFSLSGQVISKSDINRGVNFIQVQSKGVYLLKVGSVVRKVII